jgi:hypothetical protein
MFRNAALLQTAGAHGWWHEGCESVKDGKKRVSFPGKIVFDRWTLESSPHLG